MTYLRLIFFAIFSMCLWSQSAYAGQEGMGGLNINPPREIQAEGIIITWSETNDELRGFSQKLGEWEVLKIDPQKLNPQQEITPVVDSNIAAVRFGDSIAAFSGEKGWWDVVELSKNSTAVPVVSPSLAVFEDNGHLYTFSASKGQWSSPTDPELQPATFEPLFKSGEVEDGGKQFEDWLEQLPKHDARRISTQIHLVHNDFQYLITTTRQSTMKVVRQKIEEFWCPRKPVAKEATPLPDQKRSSAEIDTQITKLREDLTRLESTVQAGSGQLSNPNVDQDQQSRELRKLVEQSFDLRQQLQELEAQRLRMKLQQVENNLAIRAKSRDVIISRQLEALERNEGKMPDMTKAENGDGTKAIKENGDRGSNQTPPSMGGVSEMRTIAGDRIRWPQPSEIIKELVSSKKIYTDRLSSINHARLQVEAWSKSIDQLKSEGRVRQDADESRAKRDVQSLLEEAKERADSMMVPPVHAFTKDWRRAWSQYESLLSLLRLDVEEAQSLLNSLSTELMRLKRLSEKGLVPVEEVQKTETRMNAARINLQRAEQVLKLYADIETNEPELNPATLKGLDEIAASKEPTASVPIEPGQNLPQQVISMAEQLRKLRDAAEKLRKERQPHENLITQYSRPLEQLKAEGVVDGTTAEEDLKTQIARSKPEFDRLTEKLDAATKAWKQAWGAYQSQSRLLELEVTHAEKSLVSAEQTLGETHAKKEQGLVGSQEVRETEARREAAVARLEKAREVLHLWQELENNEPELNPDWKPESSGKNVPE